MFCLLCFVLGGLFALLLFVVFCLFVVVLGGSFVLFYLFISSSSSSSLWWGGGGRGGVGERIITAGLVHGCGGRVHSTWYQRGAATGRGVPEPGPLLHQPEREETSEAIRPGQKAGRAVVVRTRFSFPF